MIYYRSLLLFPIAWLLPLTQFNFFAALLYQISPRIQARLSGSIGTVESVKYSMQYSGDTYTISAHIQAGVSYFSVDHSPNRLVIQGKKSFSNHNFSLQGSSLLVVPYTLPPAIYLRILW